MQNTVLYTGSQHSLQCEVPDITKYVYVSSSAWTLERCPQTNIKYLNLCLENKFSATLEN